MISKPTAENIKKAAAILRDGGIVAFPTETVYGLGANAQNDQAVQKIFKVKGRPRLNPLIVHIDSFEKLNQVANIHDNKQVLENVAKLKQFWPGPLSVVLPKNPSLSNLVTAGLDSVAVRIPNHQVALALLRECGFPVAAPSANISSHVSPTLASHVEDDLGDKIDFILDGGPCSVGLESTIISLLDTKPAILRTGGIPLEKLEQALGEVDLIGGNKNNAADAKEEISKPLLAPGMLFHHYAPKTPLVIHCDIPNTKLPRRVGLIYFSETSTLPKEFDYSNTTCLSLSGDIDEVASRLFASIRAMDRLGLDLIVVERCAETGIGRAIMDRLTRASASLMP